LIEKRIKNDKENKYAHKKEILEWVNKVGVESGYSTIDVCITHESQSKKYYDVGLVIENEIFKVMRDIFSENYRRPDMGWLQILNDKILKNTRIAKEIGFINYNYDRVLEDNFLEYDYLSQKNKLSIYRKTLERLSDAEVLALYPHGSLYNTDETGSKHIIRRQETHKTDGPGFIDAVSCHESHKHVVSTYYNGPVRLFIIGLGMGLEVNLDNLDIRHPVSEIHVTIHNKARTETVVQFLSNKYDVPPEKITVHTTAEDLVTNCFNN